MSESADASPDVGFSHVPHARPDITGRVLSPSTKYRPASIHYYTTTADLDRLAWQADDTRHEEVGLTTLVAWLSCGVAACNAANVTNSGTVPSVPI